MNHPQKALVIFGAGTFANLLAHCVWNDSGRMVAAFTFNRRFIQTESLEGLPLVPFVNLAERFPPETHDMLIPLGYTRNNQIRSMTWTPFFSQRVAKGCPATPAS